VFVITENFVGASGVQIGQGATTITDGQHFSRQPPARFIALNPLRLFFGSLSDGSCNTFTRESRKFANHFFGVWVFDVQRHPGTWAKLFGL
jgi:hypothetical protein